MGDAASFLQRLECLAEALQPFLALSLFGEGEREARQQIYRQTVPNPSDEYAWQESWLAVGTLDALGDPLVLDLADGCVFSLSHDPAWTAGWDLAETSEEFLSYLEQLKRIAEQHGLTGQPPVSGKAMLALESFVESLPQSVAGHGEWDELLAPLLALLGQAETQNLEQMRAMTAQGLPLGEIAAALGLDTKQAYRLMRRAKDLP